MPRRDVRAAVLAARRHHAREVAHLRGGHDAVRDLHAHHVPAVVVFPSVEQTRPLVALIDLVRVVHRFVPGGEVRGGRGGGGFQAGHMDRLLHRIFRELQALERVRRLLERFLHDVVPVRVFHHVRVFSHNLGEAVLRHRLLVERGELVLRRGARHRDAIRPSRLRDGARPDPARRHRSREDARDGDARARGQRRHRVRRRRGRGGRADGDLRGGTRDGGGETMRSTTTRRAGATGTRVVDATRLRGDVRGVSRG